MTLENQVVVITGASSGLGKTMAMRLAGEKAKIAIIARREDKLKEVQAEILKNGGICEYFVCDISQNDQVEKTILAIIEKFGTIDILINNAGIYVQGKFLDHTPEKIQQLLLVNTLGTIQMSHAVLPILIKKNQGQILNVMSIAAVEYNKDYGVYTATKHALKGFTESLILELVETKIKVMGIYPAGMDTEIFQAANIPVEHNMAWMMKTEDVADVVFYMLTRPGDILLNHVEVRKIV